MIRFFILLLLFGLSLPEAYAQVVKTTGIQAGFLGAWVHQEIPLADRWVLRPEVGLDGTIVVNGAYEGLHLGPVIGLTPKYYHNLGKRQAQDRPIAYNNGDFLGLKINYHPGWFLLSKEDNLEQIRSLFIIPHFGIRRFVGSHFQFEVGGGIGYHYMIDNATIIYGHEEGIIPDLHLRIGYRIY